MLPFTASHNTHRHLRSPVVKYAYQMLQQHGNELLKRLQPLPPKLVDPALQVIQHGAS